MVEGRCAAELEAVRSAFAAGLAQPGQLGGAVALVVDGETVVDLWGG